MQTFEFWFKLYSLLTLIITYFLYEHKSISRQKDIETWHFYPWFHIILWLSAHSLTSLCVFLTDAINIATKNKIGSLSGIHQDVLL